MDKIICKKKQFFCLEPDLVSDLSLKNKSKIFLDQKEASSLFLFRKSYIRSFFSLFSSILDGISHGYKIKLFVKGKGLRLIARTMTGCGDSKKHVYVKLGYSHKIFFVLPKNVWVRVFERKRTLILYALNYSLLRNIALAIRSLYPVGLYKIRGIHLEKEPFRIVKGKSRMN